MREHDFGQNISGRLGLLKPTAPRPAIGIESRMAHSFNRVGNAPRFVFEISNFK